MSKPGSLGCRQRLDLRKSVITIAMGIGYIYGAVPVLNPLLITFPSQNYPPILYNLGAAPLCPMSVHPEQHRSI